MRKPREVVSRELVKKYCVEEESDVGRAEITESQHGRQIEESIYPHRGWTGAGQRARN